MSKPKILEYENLDDRREIWHLLHKLPPLHRWHFVGFCAKGCRVGNKVPELRLLDGDLDRIQEARIGRGRADEGVTNQAYALLWMLAAQYGLDLAAVSGVLVELVRGRVALADLVRMAFPNGRPAATLSATPGSARHATDQPADQAVHAGERVQRERPRLLAHGYDPDQ